MNDLEANAPSPNLDSKRGLEPDLVIVDEMPQSDFVTSATPEEIAALVEEDSPKMLELAQFGAVRSNYTKDPAHKAKVKAERRKKNKRGAQSRARNRG